MTTPSKADAVITLSVSSTDGFESSITIPASAAEADKAHSVEAWLKMMMVGLQTNIGEMRAILNQKDPTP